MSPWEMWINFLGARSAIGLWTSQHKVSRWDGKAWESTSKAWCYCICFPFLHSERLSFLFCWNFLWLVFWCVFTLTLIFIDKHKNLLILRTLVYFWLNAWAILFNTLVCYLSNTQLFSCVYFVERFAWNGNLKYFWAFLNFYSHFGKHLSVSGWPKLTCERKSQLFLWSLVFGLRSILFCFQVLCPVFNNFVQEFYSYSCVPHFVIE